MANPAPTSHLRRTLLITLLVVAFILPLVVQATDAAPSASHGYIRLPNCTDSGNCNFDDFLQLFINLYHFGLELIGPLAVLFFIIGGTLMLTAGGYETRYKLGRDILSQVIVGVIIAILSWVIVDTTIFIITGNPGRTVFGRPWYGGFTYTCDAETLQYGCTGDDVKALQDQLSSAGYTLEGGSDGVFGRSTESAVVAFQTAYNSIAQPSGCSICGVSYSADPVAFERNAVTNVWNAIFHKNCGAAAGAYGECGGFACTVDAAEAGAKLLRSDGEVDAATLSALTVVAPIRWSIQGVDYAFTHQCTLGL